MFRAFSFIPVRPSARSPIASVHGRSVACFAACCLVLGFTPALADNSLRGGAQASPHGTSTSTTPSQTTTAATTAAAQAAQTGAVAQHAQVSLQHSIQALQAMQTAQAAARSSALKGANNLGLNPNAAGQALPNVPDGLAAGGLSPLGSVAAPTQSDPNNELVPINLSRSTNSKLSLRSGGTVNLPSGTGDDQVTITGIGTITTPSGTTPFSGTVTKSLAAGSSVTIIGAGTVGYASGADTSIPITVPSSIANFATSGVAVSNWTGIGGLSQSTVTPPSAQSSAQTTVTVTQTQQQALLTWQSFNVGKNTTLDFDQSAGGANVSQWVAINEIKDPSLAPSQILGAIQAPGPVYVINQNGIIFGGSSQVNVGALTASSLALNPAYITNGLLNDSANNFQFQFSDLMTTSTVVTGPKGRQTKSTVVSPLWTAPPVAVAGGTQTVSSLVAGDITVQAGAQLSSPTNAENQGGRIALIAPNVTNHGTISTPDGQTILAAGLQVGFSAHNANDASLRGLDVYIGQVSSVASTLPTTGTFTFNGLPYDDQLTFSGSGQIGSYLAPDGTTNPLVAGTPVSIPTGSKVTLTGGTASFAGTAVGTAGSVTNAGNTLDSAGNVVVPGGDIESPRADIVLAGATVNQLGVINSSTSVTLNGRIDLLADYNASAESIGGVLAFYPFATGNLNLGGQSVTQILPELASTQTTIGTQLAFSSLVDMQGLNVELQSGALLWAPGADVPAAGSNPALDLTGVSLSSGVTVNAGSWFGAGSQGAEKSIFSNGTGQITLDSGSTIDVSGSENVSASVADDIIAAQLRGPELADSPLQRSGELRGSTVYIDLRDAGVYNGTAWIGTPLGDVSGYVNDVGRTVGELTTNGGTVALNAGTGVTIQSGATINVSGGWINYAGANVQATQVLSNGQILDISQANPDLLYQGIYSGFTEGSDKWSTSQSYVNLLLDGTRFDPGYIQGGSGGTLAISAPAMALNGSFYGNTVAGAGQRTTSAALSATYAGSTFLPTILATSAVPKAGTLDISFLQNSVNGVANAYKTTSPDVTFETDSYISQNAPVANQLLLSQDLTNVDGFGALTIDTTASGLITVPQGVSLTTVPGGSISFKAANIDIEGSLSAPGGALGFAVTDISPTATTSLFSTPPPDPTRGHFTLGADASLSSSGLLVDDRATAAVPGSQPLITNGGTISIGGLNLDLEQGSAIDVSGGVDLGATGTETFGSAGGISILGGKDPTSSSLVAGSQLFLGATLTGYSGKVGGGGSLTIQAPLVQIGGATLLNGDSSSNAMVAGETSVTGNGTTLWLDKSAAPNQASSTDFFSQGGFASFTIEGLGQIEKDGAGAYLFSAAGNPIISPAVLIASGASIKPVVQNLTVTFNGDSVTLGPLSSAQAAGLLPSQRSPANLTFTAEGVTSSLNEDGPPLPDGTTYVLGGGGGVLVRGDLVMQAGATIQTDPQTNSSHGVSLLASKGTVAVLGTVIAPGGTINVSGGNTTAPSANQLLFYDSSPDVPFATVDLGPSSVLSTAGAVELTPNGLSYATGSVLAGGNIVVSGNIVAESGATLDVSGASAVLEETPSALGQSSSRISASSFVPTRVDSNGGSITLNASQLLYSDATLLGAAGGLTAQGGNLSVSSGFSATVGSGTPPPTTADITLIVTQQGLNGGFALPTNAATGLAAVNGEAIPASSSALGATINDAVGGEPVYSYFSANPNLFLSTTTNTAVGNNGGQAGGFASLKMAGTLDFVGPVSITTSRSLNIAASSGNDGGGATGGVIYADSAVVLSSSYVALNSYQTSLQPDPLTIYAAATGGTGSLVINASTLADVGNFSPQDVSSVTFNSTPGQAGDIRGGGTLQVAGQLNLNAAQIYPPTEQTFTISANDISITAPTGGALPSLPLSAGGTLNIEGGTIEQSGVLRAPFGIINLGTGATQSVTLAAGSITSVSAVDPTTGLATTVPYGTDDQNGNWFDPQGHNITLSGPPAKAVNVNGENVHILTGSTIDLRGGGDLFAYQFVAGTGGNKDILASVGSGINASSTSFAILPGYSLDYAPDGTFAQNAVDTNNVPDAGYFNSSLAVGQEIYLNASNCLAAGVYTLLPARYALLPGAFLVSPSANGAPGASVLQPNGTSLVSGYETNESISTSLPVFGAFTVSSQASVLNQAPYAISLANTYFPTSAANANLSVPRLPNDSGQLVLDATQSMTIQGTLLSQATGSGLGGEVDIASPEDIYIVGPNSTGNVPAGALALDSSQLTDFGAASLLIGGFRTTTDAGTTVTVTTNNLVVDNSGATTTFDGLTVPGLAASDLILVSNSNLEVAANATLGQVGQLSGAAQTLTLQGNGALLRVSSDTTAKINRQNFTAGDVTSNLSIGAGASILSFNATGGPVGSLILDSTALVHIDPSTSAPPVLSAKTLTLDSSSINLEVGVPATAPTSGLVITQAQLQSLLASTQSLSLLSYSSIAIYGSGQIGGVMVGASGQKTYQEASLALHADDIYYADTANSSGVTINAQSVSLDNRSGGSTLPSLAGLGSGDLTVNAQTITLGSNAMRVDQFSTVTLNADSAIRVAGLGSQVSGSDSTPTAASFTTGGNLVMTTPLLSSAATADQSVSPTTTTAIDETVAATGSLVIQAPVDGSATTAGSKPIGATLSLVGSSITQNSGSVVLHSGALSLEATGGEIAVNGTLDATGVASPVYNLHKYTNGGQVSLTSDHGNVAVGSTGLIDLSAVSGTGTSDSGAGSGGSLTISAAGIFTPGQIKGAGGTVTSSVNGPVIAQGAGGSLTLDVGSLDSTGAGNGMLSSLENGLTGFSQQTIRDRHDVTVTVDDVVQSTASGPVDVPTKASSFDLAADQGSIVVTGTIDASNVATNDPNGNLIHIGGNISLEAGGSVTLLSTAALNASATDLSNAGQGGAVSLAAGSYEGTSHATSTASLNLGGQILLGVTNGNGGTLHLRAPQTTGAYSSGSPYTPVAVNAANGGAPVDVAIRPISSGVVQGASSIVVEGFYVQDANQASALIDNDETAAENNATTFMSQASMIQGRIFGSNAANVHVQPGEEIDNSAGSLELQNSWDLSSLRYGAPLLDAQGNQITNAAANTILSEPGILTIRAAGNLNIDFGASLNDGFDGSVGVSYTNVLLPVGSQSWSYHITTGADFNAASSSAVQKPVALQMAGTSGSLQFGYQNTTAPILLSDFNSNDLSQLFQTIRTGTGNITISSGGDVLLLNNLATIYTAGTQVDPTLGGAFTPPSGTDPSGNPLPATYSTAGGNVTIMAQGNIAHETYSDNGSTLVADSSSELPTSWLDREGSGSAGLPTTWWVDFTNYFEGVGALGGGNVTLSAAGSVVNVDAAVPTNARSVNGQLTELGGGNLVVQAGANVDGGVYYVERGQGAISAAGNIQTNSTRAAVSLGQQSATLDWLPTSYFLGEGDLSISAGGNLLLGPVANPFLLPQSHNNTASFSDLTSELSYFSTYKPRDAVDASSLAGTVTVQDFAGGGEGSLYAWYASILNANVTAPSPGNEVSDAQPWLWLAESTNPSHVSTFFGPATVLPTGSPQNVFGGVTALLPPTLRVTADTGDVNLVGSLTLSPSPVGTVDIVAAGSVNAFLVNAVTSAGVVSTFAASSTINLSDANPDALPSVSSPLTSASKLSTIDPLFTETGATEGLPLQTRQLLHADIDDHTLHAGDFTPAYIYAGSGDISGLTFFSAKQTQVIAGQDITDVGLYIQNNSATDISLVNAGRDIVGYDASSLLREQAGTNLLGYIPTEAPLGSGAGAPNSGDIQISGPGTLEVLAGRNFTLGNDAGQTNGNVAGDGLYTGLTSIGGQRNPTLSFGGADIFAGAGLGSTLTDALQNKSVNFTAFINEFLQPGSTNADTYLPDLAAELDLTNVSNDQVWANFETLSPERQTAYALDIFYLTLRDAGRNHNVAGSPGFGNYLSGQQAIAALFPADAGTYTGNIDLTSREVKTTNGGNIGFIAPGGSLTVGVDLASGQPVDQGILTVDGGNISIFANNDVLVGTSRIFTLHGGNEVIWSSVGNIDAGASSKTVVSAPPTRVLVDPTSGAVETDLAGLSTGGGIGVLASVVGAPVGDVDLIAPLGTVNAGDAGIRASGNLNIAAEKVLNADNIAVGGAKTGTPTTTSANIGALAAASSAAGSSQAAASNGTPAHQNVAQNTDALPSIITVEVLGYGGGDQD